MTLTLALAAIGGATLMAATLLSYVYASFGVGLFVIAFLFGSISPIGVPVATIGPIGLYPFDLVILVVGAASIVRMLYLSGRTRLPLAGSALILFVVIFAISFIRGLAGYDVQAAGVEFRRYLGFLVAAMYVFSFRPDAARRQAVMRWWILAGAALCALALVRWAFAVWGGETGRLRVLDARETLVVAQGMLIAFHLFLAKEPKPWLRWIAVAFLPFVVLLQHRTVWIALAVTLVVAAARERRLRAPLSGLIALGAIAVAVGALLIFGEQSTVVLGESATTGSTFTWRLMGWQALLEHHVQDPWRTLFGAPFGAGFERELTTLGYSTGVSPHNFYVTMFLRGGPIALVCFLIVYGYALVRTDQAARRSAAGAVGYRSAFVILLTQLIYFVSYEPDFEQGVMLGISLAVAAGFQVHGLRGSGALQETTSSASQTVPLSARIPNVPVLPTGEYNLRDAEED